MADSGRVIRPIVIALCAGVTIAGLINVYGDNSETIAKAESAACGKPACAVRMTRMERNPFSQSFTFQTKLEERPNLSRELTVDIVCHRAYYLVGDYSCATRAGP